MHIIVIGCGKVGSKFAELLSVEGHDVVIVDNDSSAFKLLSENFNGLTVTGVPIDQDVLKRAGIETADALAAVTPDDNVNVMVSQVAKEIFKVPKVIARIYNPSREHVFREFGLETICPTDLTVDVIHSKIMGEENIALTEINNNFFVFREEKITNELVGKKLNSIKFGDDESIFGVTKGGKFIFPNESVVLSKDDELIIVRKV